jgi:hypothetical protein
MNVFYKIDKPILLRLKNLKYGYSVICPNQKEQRHKLMDNYILSELVFEPDMEFQSIFKYDSRDVNNIFIIEFNDKIPWIITQKENKLFNKFFK